jgi:hypothetical protein
VARVAAFIPDLLFGSNVLGALQAAGHEVRLVNGPVQTGDADILIVDLTADPSERLEQIRGADVKTLAFYSHVENEVRAQALAAGIDLVVPRSRMAREAPSLVAKLSASEK